MQKETSQCAGAQGEVSFLETNHVPRRKELKMDNPLYKERTAQDS